MKVRFDYYRAFFIVAKYNSLTLAAQAIGVTQPALSKIILTLEKELGCQLFKRRHKGMELTSEGAILYRYIARACEQIESGEKTLNSLVNLSVGEIHVGSSDIILKSFLLPLLGQFHKKYSQIKLRTFITTVEESGQLLREGTIDLAIVTSPLRRQTDLTSHEIGEVHDIFVAGAGFEHLRDKVFTFEEIVELPLICPGPNTGQRQFCDNFFHSRDLNLKPEVELATAMLVPSFAQAGLGVGIVMREVIGEELKEGLLFEIRTETSLPSRKFSIVTKKGAVLSSGCKSLIQTLKKNFRKQTAPLSA